MRNVKQTVQKQKFEGDRRAGQLPLVSHSVSQCMFIKPIGLKHS